MQITKEIAHVMRDENLFVYHVEPTGESNQFVSEFCVKGTHPYLYENQSIANHVSGTSFLDSSRQLLKAICHLFYDVPIENRFVMRKVSLDFTRWAKLNVPIKAVVDCQNQITTLRGQICLTFSGQISYYQEGWKIGVTKGKFTTFSRNIEDLLMSRQYAQPPLETETNTAEFTTAAKSVS